MHRCARPPLAPGEGGRFLSSPSFSLGYRIPAIAQPRESASEPTTAERSSAAPDHGPDHRAGFVALVGLPNVGKSTLLNRLVSTRLGIVTPKAQTTRRRVTGIYTDDAHQAVYFDTPGILSPRYLLQGAMQEEICSALRDADLLVYVVDAGFPPSLEGARGFRPPAGTPALLCVNKTDRVPAGRARELRREFEAASWTQVLCTAAVAGHGVPELQGAILGRLPRSPPLYPKDEISTQPVRFFAAEFIRETCFERLGEEVPYCVAVRIDEFRERAPERPIYIAATLFVEKRSQKGIVVGAGGRKIREIGTAGRGKIEQFLGRGVYLELRVKVLANWRRRPGALRMLGFHALPKEP
ncbi:MAG: GTPase Era [Gemmatimonadota bacterium]